MRPHKLMFIPVTAFAGLTADLCMGVRSQQPAVSERLLEHVAFIGQACREVILESPPVTQQPGIVDVQTLAAASTDGAMGLLTL